MEIPTTTHTERHTLPRILKSTGSAMLLTPLCLSQSGCLASMQACMHASTHTPRNGAPLCTCETPADFILPLHAQAGQASSPSSCSIEWKAKQGMNGSCQRRHHTIGAVRSKYPSPLSLNPRPCPGLPSPHLRRKKEEAFARYAWRLRRCYCTTTVAAGCIPTSDRI
jgi:hypothetical protein